MLTPSAILCKKCIFQSYPFKYKYFITVLFEVSLLEYLFFWQFFNFYCYKYLHFLFLTFSISFTFEVNMDYSYFVSLCAAFPASQISFCFMKLTADAARGNKDVKHVRRWNRYRNVEKRRVRVSYLQYPCSPLTGLSYFSHSIFAVRLPTKINMTWASGGFA